MVLNGSDWFNAEALYNAIREALGNAVQIPRLAQLGRELEDGTRQLRVPSSESDQPGLFYFSNLEGFQTFSGEAILKNEAVIPPAYQRYGMPVRIVRDDVLGMWVIEGLDPVLSNAYLSTPDTQPPEPVRLHQILPSLLDQTEPPSGQLRAMGAPYYVNGVLYYHSTATTGDLLNGTTLDVNAVAITPPAIATRARAVLVQRHHTTGALSYKQGAEFDAALNFVSLYTLDRGGTPGTYLPLADDGHWTIGYARIQTGQTAILRQRHIWAVHEILSSGGAGGEIVTSEGRVVVDDDGNVVYTS